MICSLPDKRAGIRVDENGAIAAPAHESLYNIEQVEGVSCPLEHSIAPGGSLRLT